MRIIRNKHIVSAFIAVFILSAISCSTQKNTAQTRWWHSFNAKYNTYYNGSLAYIDGSLEKENGNKDNFTEMIPLYTVGNKNSKELGKSNFDRAIEKCEKAIKLHSIKHRPEWNKNRHKTEKDVEWLTRREYNPFLWKAWLLMGRSQFYKGAFDEAASTFSYMSRLYKGQPAIYGKARAWLAKCYTEQGWLYDADDVINNMKRDSMDWRAVKEWDYTYADYYIRTEQYDKAIPYLHKVIRHEMRRKQKAREWYLLGQLEAEQGHKELAYKAFKHVIRLNPPYELEFNAHIAMTEVMAAGRSRQMIGKLKRMAASDNNKDYLDQVYYAIGNIYMTQRDTANAITAYEQGNKKATRSGIEKGVLLLRLGDIYWQKNKFSDARRCYGEAIGLLDKDRKDYKQLSERSVVLDELVPFTDAVQLQDSLQSLAKMTEKDRNAAIDRVIVALKKKEKEEKRAQEETDAQNAQNKDGGNPYANNNNQNKNTSANNNQGLWYFYNPMTVNQGKTTFQRQWGKRENVDNWQRINTTVVGQTGADAAGGLSDAARDSINAAEAAQDSLSNIKDSAQNDPHKREYYLAQIPFTEDQVKASNVILEDGLYHAGVIFKDKLDNLGLSEKYLRRLSDDYIDYEHLDDVYYHLFLLYSRMNQPVIADSYVEKLKEKFPRSQWTAILSDPNFKENAMFGTHIEDSLYAATYQAFKNDRYTEVSGNTHISETRFPLGANRDKFIFIGGLSKLNSGDAKGCLTDMKTVVEKYPNSRISEMAGMIVNGVNGGRKLHGGKFNLDDVWSRRSVELSDSDSTRVKNFSAERNTDFLFMLAYKTDSVNENQLLFEMAKFNFTNYLVRNFDIAIEDVDGVHHMTIKGFRNYDEVHLYATQLFANHDIAKRIGRCKRIIISEINMPLLGTKFSYADYDKFYLKHFAPVKTENLLLLTEPTEIEVEKPSQKESEPEQQEGVGTDDGMYINTGSEKKAPPTDNGIVIPQEENNGDVKKNVNGTTPPSDAGIVIPQDNKKTPTTPADDGIIINTEEKPTVTDKKPAATDDGITIKEDELKQTPSDNGVTVIDEKPKAEVNNHQQPQIQTKPQVKPQIQTKPQVKPQAKPQTQPKPKPQVNPQNAEPAHEDTGIDFDDGFGSGTGTKGNNNQPDNKQKKKSDVNLEDEYYDLDGF